MKMLFNGLFLWSWLFTLLVTGLGAYWTYQRWISFMPSGSGKSRRPSSSSSIDLFDSYLDRPLSGKRITVSAVDQESRVQAMQATVLPVDDTTAPAISQALQNLSAATLAQVVADRRQAVCDG